MIAAGPQMISRLLARTSDVGKRLIGPENEREADPAFAGRLPRIQRMIRKKNTLRQTRNAFAPRSCAKD